MHTQLSSFPASIHGLPIDRRIRRLVGALNQVPGITTSSSCGGHRKRDLVCQLPISQFKVDFYVTENRQGWRALELVLKACDVVSDCLLAQLDLTAWLDGGLRWELKGKGCHPDYVAQMIERALEVGQQHA